MQAAFLVHICVPDGTPIEKIRADIDLTLVIDIDNETEGGCLEALAVDSSSVQTYDPKYDVVVRSKAMQP